MGSKRKEPIITWQAPQKYITCSNSILNSSLTFWQRAGHSFLELLNKEYSVGDIDREVREDQRV